MSRKWVVPIVVMLFLISNTCTAYHYSSPVYVPNCRISWGPSINKIVYIIIPEEEMILALENDDIDLIGHSINPDYKTQLEESDNIEVVSTPLNSYTAFIFNCQKYPFNITALRRAFAFAIDKNYISDEIWGDLHQPLDSCVSTASHFSIEGFQDYDYYSQDLVTASRLLQQAGFIDTDSDSYLECPNGDQLEILIDYANDIAKVDLVLDYVISILNALGIRATTRLCETHELDLRLASHGDYDVALRRFEIGSLDVDWIGSTYHSESVYIESQNLPNFSNTSYDSYVSTLVNSPDYDAIAEAALEMQRIWTYECPLVICYEEFGLSAFRTDKYQRHKNMPVSGVLNWWSLCRTQLQDNLGGPYGGYFRVGITHFNDTFNPLLATIWTDGYPMSMMYDSLGKRTCDGVDKPLLANTWMLETHEENSTISDGHLRITFLLEHSATWTNGRPCTGNDIVQSLLLYKDLLEHDFGGGLDHLVAVYSPEEHKVIVEFDTESYWCLHDIIYLPILPKQYCTNPLFLDWHPNVPYDSELVSMGPFYVSDVVLTEFVELTYNPDYYYLDPLEMPYASYVPWLDGHTIYSYLEGTLGHELSWHFLSGYVKSYEIFIDSILWANDTYQYIRNGITIRTNVDGLPPGLHNITLRAYNDTSLVDSYSIALTVIPILLPAMGISLVSTVIIGYCVLKRRETHDFFGQS